MFQRQSALCTEKKNSEISCFTLFQALDHVEKGKNHVFKLHFEHDYSASRRRTEKKNSEISCFTLFQASDHVENGRITCSNCILNMITAPADVAHLKEKFSNFMLHTVPGVRSR